MNGPIKLEYYITVTRKGLLGVNTLTFKAHFSYDCIHISFFDDLKFGPLS
jgi:hypothetical protein